MRSKAIIWAPVIFLAGGLAGWFGHQTFQKQQPAPVSVMDSATAENNDGAPSVDLPDLNGRQVKLTDYQGKVLVVNLWASWCPPCQKETPEFVALQKELGDKGVQFIGIGVDEEKPIREFVTRMGVNYPILLAGDQGDQILLDFGDTQGALPYTLVIDRSGKVRERHLGYYPQDELRQTLQGLIQEKA